MNKQTIISTPSIADTNVLYARWIAIPGNENKSQSDFYSFLRVESIERSIFFSENTVESFDDVKYNIVVLKVTPK
jgi:hypothetical protein